MIPITKAIFDEEDLKIIQEPLKSGWVVQGKFVKEFEEMFSGFTGAKHSAAVSSCTTGLHIIMAALGLKPGDEVIVPAFTWVATANCIEYMGAKPVFVDVRTDTFNLNPELIEAKINSNTKGIIAVHLFGLLADMDAIMQAAEKHNLWLVEDAACAFDSWYKGKHAGTFGNAASFSFHPRKSITTGEGGMVTTNEKKLDSLFRTLRDHGASKSDHQRHIQKYSFLLAEYHHLGYNFRMTDIQGALGVSQMRKAKKIMEGRRTAAELYNKKLRNIEWLQLPFSHQDYLHGYQSYVCLFTPEKPSLDNCDKLFQKRNEIMYNLEEKGIITRQGTHSAAHVDYYKSKYGINPEDLPASYISERCSITLPLFAGMSEEEIDLVVKSLIKEFKKVSV